MSPAIPTLLHSKTWILPYLVFICSASLSAQHLNENTGNVRLYEFKIECPMYKCDISGNIIDSSILVAPPNAKFTLVECLSNHYVIRFTLLPNSKKIGGNFFTENDFTTYTYFIITKAQLDFKAVSIKKSNLNLLVGNIFTPIKLRFKPFDFAKDISVGTTFGGKYSFTEKQNTAVDGLIGIGISSLSIDSSSAQKSTNESNELLAFTSSLGLVLEFGNAQLGIFIGFDLISNTNQKKYDWIYKNKPWLSFGVGYSLFSFNVKK